MQRAGVYQQSAVGRHLLEPSYHVSHLVVVVSRLLLPLLRSCLLVGGRGRAHDRLGHVAIVVAVRLRLLHFQQHLLLS